jgi:uncharacterized protein YbjT (DUF2867 family)
MSTRRSICKTFACLIALILTVPVLAGDLVLVAGATGRTGQKVVSELLANDYSVRAFVRDAGLAREKLGSDIEYAEGDVRQRETIDAALDGVAAIISAIGASRDDPSNGPEFVDYGGVKNLAEAAADAGLSQIVLVSSAGVGREDSALNRMFGELLMWKFKGEEAVRNSGVPYTIVRPGGLTDGPGGEKSLEFVQGDDRQGRVPRADVARVLVAALSLPEAQNKTFGLFGGEGPPSIELQIQFAAMEED